MTVVHPSSISGISSLTTAASSEVLSFHINNTSERLRITAGGMNVTGVVTATSFDGGDFSIADKIVHTGDTNTALRFPSADTVTVETGGTKRLEITSDGKYYFTGTGAGSGSRGLEIDTEAVGAQDEGVILNARASGTTGRIKLQTNSATAMTILGNGGNIGIGTDNPDALLHLQSASSPTIHLEDTTQTTKLKFYAQDSSTVIGNYSNHALQFVSNSLSRIQLTNDGKVQIGLPGNSSSLPGAVDSVSIRARDEGNLHIRDIGNLTSSPAGTGVGIDVLNNASNAVKDLCIRASTLIFRHASAETLRIGSSGQFGIAGANYGSSGQVLTSQGGSAAPQWATAGGATVQSGSWTPAWTGHSGTPSAVDTAYGKYTRIGELVFIECYIKSGTRGSATGPVRVGGLPFDRTNDTHDQVLGSVAWDYSGSSIDYSGQNRADHINMIAWIPNNTGYIRFAHQLSASDTAYRANNAGSTDLNWIICGSSSGNYLSFRFSGCYRTDAA